jgi:thiol-disulfide isomerase/thioredoxin
MKAKKSLMAVLWPLLKQNIVKSTRYLKIGVRFVKAASDKKRMNLKVLEERITESGKLVESSKQNAERLKQESRMPRILPDGEQSKKYHDRDKGRGEGSEVQMSWREDEEEDRSGPCFDSALHKESLGQHDNRIDSAQYGRGVVWSLLFGMGLSRRGPVVASLAPQYSEVVECFDSAQHDNSFDSAQHDRGVRMRWILVLVLIMGIYSAKASAQSPAGLQAGDQVPDVIMSNLINYKTGTAKLSDFKGKLLILDFWSTWCKGCLESFENADILQKQFGDQLQVLFITSQSSAENSKFLAKNTRINNYKLQIATDDLTLKKLFPYASVPHLVWISPEGKLIQTTASYDFTKQNVEKLLLRQEVSFKAPKADELSFDTGRPLFDRGNGGPAVYRYRSLISGFQQGLPGSIGSAKDSVSIRVHALNQGIISLYKKALQLPAYWPRSRLVFEQLDRSTYEISNWYEEREAKAWCYELILPLSREQDLYPIMLQDLSRFFHLDARIEERETPCYVLRTSDAGLIPPEATGERQNNLLKNDDRSKFMQNDWLSSLIEYLDDQPGMPPVFDESGITYRLNLDLGTRLTDLDSLNKALAKQGLQFKSEQRSIPMLILSPSIKSPNAQN